MTDPLQRLRHEEKSAAGWWTTWVWIISGVYFFSRTRSVSLFSISALVFIGGGMFVSVAVFGMGFYMLQRLIGLIVVAMDRRKWINALGGSTATTVRIVGLVLFSAELVSTFLGARWVFYTFVV